MVADFAEYAGALFSPLLLIGAIVAIVLTGLASTLRADSRFVRIGFIAVGALLAASSIWLVLYARGPDDYGGQTVSRWEYAQSYVGTWPVVVAVAGGIATSLGLIATAYVSSWARWRPVASLFAVIACPFLVFGWFSLTAGH